MLVKNFLNYKNKVLVLTGSSGELGEFITKLFISLDCKVYGLDKAKSNRIKSEKFIFQKLDITNKSKLTKVLRKIYNKEKQVDIIINNAAVSPVSPFLKRTEVELKDTIDVNLISIINTIKCITSFHNKKNNCKIINIGSIYGVKSPDFKIYKNKDRINSEIYGSSKAAVIHLTKYFASLLAKKNITVNCISPGGIKNNKKQNTKFVKKYSRKVPMGRMCKIDDLIMALIYFSNDLTNYTTGQNLIIDGGFTL